jgi:hypothetical protein
MSRRQWLWITGAVSSGLLIALTVVDFELKSTGGPGIVPFEVAGSTDRAQEILAEWGESGRDFARLSIWLDFPYLVAYGAFFALAVAAMRDAARDRRWERLGRAGSIVVIAPIAAAAFDAVEDVGLLLVVGGHADSAAPAIAGAFALAKFVALGATVAYLLAGLVTLGRERMRDRRSPSPDGRV